MAGSVVVVVVVTAFVVEYWDALDWSWATKVAAIAVIAMGSGGDVAVVVVVVVGGGMDGGSCVLVLLLAATLVWMVSVGRYVAGAAACVVGVVVVMSATGMASGEGGSSWRAFPTDWSSSSRRKTGSGGGGGVGGRCDGSSLNLDASVDAVAVVLAAVVVWGEAASTSIAGGLVARAAVVVDTFAPDEFLRSY